MTTTHFDIAEGRRAAEAALRHMRTGLASPDLLSDLLEQLPQAQREPFLAQIQKAIEQFAQVPA